MSKMLKMVPKETNVTALVIEKSEFELTVIKKFLTQMGITDVEYAHNINKASKLIAKNKYNLILCEYELKKENYGIDLLKEIRKENNYNPAFVLMTSNNNKETLVDILQHTPEDILIKPFTAEIFNNRIHQVVLSFITTKNIRKALEKEDYETALHYLSSTEIQNRMKKNKAFSSWVSRTKIEILMNLKRYRAAEDYTSYLISNENNDLESFRTYHVKALLMQKNYSEAIRAATECIKKYPLSIKSYLYLGEAYYNVDFLEQSTKSYKRALDLSKRSIPARRAISKIFHEIGNCEEALDSYQKLMSLIEKSKEQEVEDYYNYANVTKENAEINLDTSTGQAIVEALDIIKRGQNNFPDDILLDVQEKIYHAQELLHKGNEKAALSKIESTMKSFSHILNRNSIALINTIITLQQLGEDDKAESLKEGMLINKMNEELPTFELRLSSFKNKDFKTKRQIESLLKDSDDYINENYYPQAISRLKEALELSPDSSALHFKLLETELTYMESGGLSKPQLSLCIQDFKNCRSVLTTINEQNQLKKIVKRFKALVELVTTDQTKSITKYDDRSKIYMSV